MFRLEQGDLADARMRGAAIQRGVAITSTSRPIRREDFEDFDIILAMDRSNVGEHMDKLTSISINLRRIINPL